MMGARQRLDALVDAGIDRRTREHDDRDDLLGLLLAATDNDGRRVSGRQVGDYVATMLFAGHDTTTSTVAFLPRARPPPRAREDGCRPAHRRDAPPLSPGLGRPRARSREPFTVAGVDVPGGVPVSYFAWASHRLPDVWPDRDRFRPRRFSAGRRDAIPRGAHVPFGGGSRMCIGIGASARPRSG